MILKSIELNNIRSYKSAAIEFNRGITVITGKTGSGKSTLLMALEYALFGNDSTMAGSALLRRGADNGRVKVTVLQNNNEYTIIRGLKRNKDKVQFDKDNIEIYKNEERIPIISRVSDLDELIRLELGYEKEKNACELFGVTSYTRQDEIKKLLELTTEKRQEFIDKILQLSKYKTAWNNLKEVQNYFMLRINRIEGSITNKKSVESELANIKQEILENKENIKEIRNRIERVKNEHEKSVNNLKELTGLFSKAKDTREKRLGVSAKLSQSRAREKRIEEEIKRTRKEKQEIETSHQKKDTENIDELSIRFGRVITAIESKKEEIKKIEREFEKTERLGKGVCPTCKQEVSENHIHNLKSIYKKNIEENQRELEKNEKELEIIKMRTLEAEKTRDALIKIELLEQKKKELERESTNLRQEVITFEEELSKTIENDDYETLQNRIEEARNKKEEITIAKERLQEREQHLEENTNKLEERKQEKQEELKNIEKEEILLKDFSEAKNFITSLREDVRNIREAVRNKFLDALKTEFHRNFEEIRRFEEDYVVDVKINYEPVAYASNGLEVPITSLSGGEKTSVALAYRLALSNIAAEMSGLSRSEILVLDEPTVGFDSDDVRILPEVLQKIRIPQIIIVTHEEELKGAATINYIIDKKTGTSIITKE